MSNTLKNLIQLFIIAIVSMVGAFNVFADDEWELASVIGRGAIYELDLSPDDSKLAVATSIGVWIYDSQTFEVLHFLAGYRSRVETVDWSPNNKQLVVGGYSGELDIWDVNTEQRNRLLDEDQWRIEAVAWSSDGNMIAFSTSDYANEIIRLWDVKESKVILEIDDLSLSLAWSPDNSLLATGSEDWLSIRDAKTGESLVSFRVSIRGGEWTFRSIAWSPDGTRIASTTDDGDLNIWTLADRESLNIRDYPFNLSNVVWSPDGTQIAAGTEDETVIFKAESGEVIKTIESTIQGAPRIRGNDRIKSIHVQWSSDGQTLYTAGWHEYINRWDANTGELLNSTGEHYRFFTIMAWSPNHNIIAAGLFDSSIRLWDGETGEHLTSLYGHGDLISALAWSPDGTKLSAGNVDARAGGPPGSLRPAPNYGQTVRIWDTETGNQLYGFVEQRGSVGSITWSSDGTQLASGNDDDTVYIWSTITGEELHIFELSRFQYLQELIWSPDNKMLASLEGDRIVEIWNTQTWELLQTITIEDTEYIDDFVSIEWSPDSSELYIFGDELIRTVNIESGEYTDHIMEDTIFEGSTWTANGTMLVWGSNLDDNTKQIWDMTNDQLITTFIYEQPSDRNVDNFRELSWSSDKRLLSISNNKGVLTLWDAQNGNIVANLSGHSQRIFDTSFSYDDTLIASLSYDNTIRLWKRVSK